MAGTSTSSTGIYANSKTRGFSGKRREGRRIPRRLKLPLRTVQLQDGCISSYTTGADTALRCMADARRNLDWEAQWECAMDPETAKKIREDRKPEHDDTCSMCGKFCAVRSMNKALSGEYIDIL